MNTKIYVGNILYEVTDQDLHDLFSAYGQVVAAEVVRYQKSKRSKGFGFVRMATEDQARAAIQALNDQDYRGRKLFLDLARSEDPTPEVREKQKQGREIPTYTPMPAQPQPEPIQVEEVHPDVHVEPPAPPATPLPPVPPPVPHVAPPPQGQEVPVQPQPPAPQPEPSIRNFGTIFSNSPRSNDDQ